MIWLVIIMLIICATILFAMYLYFCADNNTGLFIKPEYNGRLRNLEEEQKKLIQEIRELKDIIKEQNHIGGFKVQ